MDANITRRNLTAAERGLLFTEDAEAPANEVEIPEDLTALENEDLSTLHEQVLEAFDLIVDAAGESPTAEQVEDMTALADGIEALRGEIETRDAATTERAEQAAALSKRVKGNDETAPSDEDVQDADTEEASTEDSEDAEEAVQEPKEAVTASGGSRRIAVPARRASKAPEPKTAGMKNVAFAAPDVPGLSTGQGVEWSDLATATSRRLASFPEASFRKARQSGRKQRQQYALGIFQKDIPSDLTITSDSPESGTEIMSRAANETRLPGGSLTASGGWCAPSETLYDLVEVESRDGILSMPEVGITRGGIHFTRGPDFGYFYENSGFSYTEEDDLDGNYGVDEDGVGDGTEGDKPCVSVPCPEFEEVRLGVEGVCISAGLLQSRAYPEMLERTLRGTLIAHDHRVNAKVINSIQDGSEAISMPAGQVGALAPLLTAIELHVEHMKDLNRMSRTTSVESVFPFWVRGVVRADLSRRLGVDLFTVTDAEIDAWFRSRGAAPQYVYDWQSLATTDAGSLTAYPEEVTFLLYPAGTWVKGTSDIITLDTVYDSTLLAQNDFTALFTEEGLLTAKMGHDSRAITVPVCADGATAAGVAIECDGTEAVAGG